MKGKRLWRMGARLLALAAELRHDASEIGSDYWERKLLERADEAEEAGAELQGAAT